MRVSIILPTVSPSTNALHPSLRDVGVFDMLEESLAAQKLPRGVNIEVVVVDSLSGKREQHFLPQSDWIYVRAPAEWCFQNILRHHYADRNAALATATGEVVYQMDDWCSFEHDSDHIARIVDYHRRGYCLGSLVRWQYGDAPDEKTPYQGRDWRMDDWLVCVCQECQAGTSAGHNKTWLGDGQDLLKPRSYGVQAFPRRAAYAIGGYDEVYDGGASYGDLDFGFRLQVAGEKLALDLEHYVVHQRHGGPDPDAVDPDILTHCNRAYWLTQQALADHGQLDPRANWTPPGPGMTEVLRGEGGCPFYLGDGKCSSGQTCDYYGLGAEQPLFKEWLESRPRFDLVKYAAALRKQRKMVRREARA